MQDKADGKQGAVDVIEGPEPIRLVFQAALVVQMANMSLQRGRRLRWNTETKKVEG